MQIEPRSTLWTLGTFRNQTIAITNRLSRLAEANSEIFMARESEKTSIERMMMEMMLQMQMQEKENTAQREQEDHRREERREVERL